MGFQVTSFRIIIILQAGGKCKGEKINTENQKLPIRRTGVSPVYW